MVVSHCLDPILDTFPIHRDHYLVMFLQAIQDPRLAPVFAYESPIAGLEGMLRLK